MIVAYGHLQLQGGLVAVSAVVGDYGDIGIGAGSHAAVRRQANIDLPALEGLC